MSYSIFLDDERIPALLNSTSGSEWVIVRNNEEFLNLVRDRGMPEFISFDHDLGQDTPTGYDIAKTIVYMDLYKVDGFEIPDNFDFYVHSQNPVGAKNIESYLNNYLKIKRAKNQALSTRFHTKHYNSILQMASPITLYEP